MNQYTDEEKKNIKRKGNKQIYWNDNSSKHNKTFRISPGKGKTSYLLLTSMVRDNRGIQLRMWLK